MTVTKFFWARCCTWLTNYGDAVVRWHWRAWWALFIIGLTQRVTDYILPDKIPVCLGCADPVANPQSVEEHTETHSTHNRESSTHASPELTLTLMRMAKSPRIYLPLSPPYTSASLNSVLPCCWTSSVTFTLNSNAGSMLSKTATQTLLICSRV